MSSPEEMLNTGKPNSENSQTPDTQAPEKLVLEQLDQAETAAPTQAAAPHLDEVLETAPTQAAEPDPAEIPALMPAAAPAVSNIVAATPAASDITAATPAPAEADIPAADAELASAAAVTADLAAAAATTNLAAAAAAAENPQSRSGNTLNISWAAQSDVGLVRGHNEDSFLAQPPLFAVCDGMGGHAAGEVASAIAVSTIAQHAPVHADEAELATAIEAANTAVIEGAQTGKGKPGMGCTASAILVEQDKMAVAHVGDSRVYLLHAGTLVRLTHDHSYVEELVDAGEITADEARVHPSRSIITRALGSDPDMYADHFSIDVSLGDRVIVCSDGLSSMIEDSEIETIAVSSPTPDSCVDKLIGAALHAGGHDNVTCVVVDITDDGLVKQHRRFRNRRLAWIIGVISALLIATSAVAAVFVRNSWFVGAHGGVVAIYQGVKAEIFGYDLSALYATTEVQVEDLPDNLQARLREGVVVASEQDARNTIENYREQISAEKSQAKQTASKSTTTTEISASNPATPKSTAPAPSASADAEGSGE